MSLYRLHSDDLPLLRADWQQTCGGDLRLRVADCRQLVLRGELKEQMRGSLGAR